MENLREDVLESCGQCAASVYQAMHNLGGKIHMRVMDLRKHMPIPFGESTTKKGIKALLEAGFIERVSHYDANGMAYRIIK
jgi:predicted transcriptional regulator